MRYLIVLSMTCLLAVPANAAVLGTQDGEKAEAKARTMATAAQEKRNAYFFTEMSFNETVTGAPFSGESINESIQTLADGNRIVRRTTTMIYRDGEGRVRREMALQGVGPWAAEGDGYKSIFITDPVAGTSYILNPEARTAQEMPAPRVFTTEVDNDGSKNVFVIAGAEKRQVETQIRERQERTEKVIRRRGENAPISGVTSGDTVVFAPNSRIGAVAGGPQGVILEYMGGDEENAKSESLGTKTIEGVQAEGTRRTITIPAGKIGNELPIEIVSERWYSPDLKMTVMTRHTDPRFGETTYRLTNIDHTEPSPALFAPPSDYKIEKNTGNFTWSAPKIRSNDE